MLFFDVFKRKNKSLLCSLLSSIDFVDKRGSRVEKTSTEDLHRFYEMSDESDRGTFSEHSHY